MKRLHKKYIEELKNMSSSIANDVEKDHDFTWAEIIKTITPGKCYARIRKQASHEYLIDFYKTIFSRKSELTMYVKVEDDGYKFIKLIRNSAIRVTLENLRGLV